MLIRALRRLGERSLLSEQLVRGGMGSFVVYALQRSLMFATSIVLARLLGAQGLGIYASAIAAMTLIGVPASLGLPTLVIRLVAAYRVRGEWDLMRGLLGRVNQVLFAVTIAVGGIADLIVWLSVDHFGAAWAAAFWWATALLPLGVLSSVRSGALRGLRHVVLGQVPDSIIMPATLLLALACWHLLGESLDPQTAMALRVAGTCLAFTVGAWILHKVLPPEVHRTSPKYDTGTWTRSAIPLMLLTGMAVLTTQTDVLMLAALRGGASAGIYQAAARGAELVTFSMVIVNISIQPSLSHLHVSGEYARLQKVITVSARIAFVASLPIAILLGALAGPLMHYVYGAEFQRGAVCLVILCITQVINIGFGPARDILTMTGHEKEAAVATAVGATANVILNAALIPYWDVEGAAIATGLSLVIWNAVLAATVRRRLGLHSTVLGRVGDVHPTPGG